MDRLITQRKLDIKVPKSYRTVETISTIAIARMIPRQGWPASEQGSRKIDSHEKKELEETSREWQKKWNEQPVKARGG